MLMELFEAWCRERKAMQSRRNFEQFYQEQSLGKSFIELFAELAYETYELQVCVEGLIEDEECV